MRGNGDGAVTHVPGRRLPWRAEVTMGWTGDGKRIRKARYASSEKGARDALRQLLRERDLGLVGPDSTLADYLEVWYAGLRLAPRTLVSYRGHIDAYLVPALGGTTIRTLTPAAVRLAINAIEHSASNESRKVGSGTRERVLATLRSALAQAVSDGILERNVAALVKVRRERSAPAAVALTGDQVRTVLAGVAEDRLYALYLLAVVTGMRQGELLGLRWVDVAGDRIHVRHALARLDGEYVLVAPKSASGRRDIVLGASAIAALRSHKAKQAAEQLAAGAGWHDRGLVFTRPDGEALNAGVVTHDFQAQLARLELPKVRFHDLRHTAASLLVERTGDLKAAQALLGHATIGLTADVYTHVQEGQLRATAAALDAVVRGGHA